MNCPTLKQLNKKKLAYKYKEQPVIELSIIWHREGILWPSLNYTPGG